MEKEGLIQPLKMLDDNFLMKPESFKDYKPIAQQCHFQTVPYTKVKCIMYEPKILRYKTAFSAEWVTKNVVERQSTRSGALFVIADHKTAIQQAWLSPKKMTSRKC